MEQVRGPLANPETPFSQHWAAYRDAYAGDPGPAWFPQPNPSNVARLADEVGARSFADLHRWSVNHRAAFWAKTLDALGVRFDTEPAEILDEESPVEDPEWLPGAMMNAAAMCFQGDAEKVAIVAGKEGSDALVKWTYGELEDVADRVSCGLQAMGMQTGDAVALYMPMTAECVAAYLGIVQAGMVVVSIPDSFAPEEVATRLKLGNARLIITVDAFARGGKQVPMASKAQQAAGLLPDPPALVVVGEAGKHVSWDRLTADDSGFNSVPRHPQDTTNILFSSGTTGEPKAIPWTHLSPIKAAGDGHWHQDVQPTDVVAWPTNIGWMMGPWLIYASLANRATMALYEGAPTGEDFLQFLRQAKVSILGVVPSIVRSWMQSGATPHSLPDVRLFSSTGEASNPHDYLFLMSMAGYRAPVIEYCGGTEIGGGHLTGSVMQAQAPALFSTPALGLDLVVLDDEGRPVEEGLGELYLIPPSIGLSQRLLNRNHHDEYYAGCPPGPANQVLRRHGDEVELLPGGFIRAQGRADDTMNLGGIKVGSIELETAMNGDESVLETAAVAVSPPEGGAANLVVFAVLQDGATDAGLAERLQLRIKSKLNPLFRIHDVVVVDALPRTASNKVMRRELRSAYQQSPPA